MLTTAQILGEARAARALKGRGARMLDALAVLCIETHGVTLAELLAREEADSMRIKNLPSVAEMVRAARADGLTDVEAVAVAIAHRYGVEVPRDTVRVSLWREARRGDDKRAQSAAVQSGEQNA